MDHHGLPAAHGAIIIAIMTAIGSHHVEINQGLQTVLYLVGIISGLYAIDERRRRKRNDSTRRETE